MKFPIIFMLLIIEFFLQWAASTGSRHLETVNLVLVSLQPM